MAEIKQLPAGLNVSCAIGDNVVLDIFVKEQDEPVNISTWVLESENVFLNVIDATIGHFQLTFNQEFSNSNAARWFVRRKTPKTKRILAGLIQFVLTTDEGTPNGSFDLNILETPELTLTVFTGDKGDTGAGLPVGGDEFQLIEKASDTDYDTRWTSKPTIKGLRFDTADAATLDQAGDLAWDDLDQALSYRTNGLTVDIAQENLVYVRNPPGNSTISKGSAVAVLGSASNRLTVQLCDATAGGDGCRTLGVVMNDIPSPGFGFVSTFGLLRGFNTNNIIGGGVTAGSEVFISSTPGVLSTQPQASPGRRVAVGYVVTTGTQGAIFVTIRRGLTVAELDNVAINGLTDKQILRYDAVDSRFENVSLGSAADANVGDFATSAQGSLADTAIQPNDNVSSLTNDANYIDSAGAPVQSVAGKTGTVVLDKTDVGLSNVDNTSDLNKPISTDTQNALNLKANDADISVVGKTGSYNDLLNKPDLSLLEEVLVFASLTNFPVSGEGGKVYIAEDTGYIYRWNGTGYTQLTDQTAVWGQISGTLSNQTDLQNALNLKYDASNPSGFTTNTGTVTSVDLTAGTGISVSGSPITTSGTITVTNTAPDQIVSLTGAGATSVSGTYPIFTITSTDTNTTYTAGTGLNLTGTVFSIDSTVATLNGTQTLTNKTISGTNNTFSNIGNASLTNSSLTVNGISIALGGSGTVTAVNPQALTIGTGLSGTSYNGSSAVTVAIDSTVATLTGTQTLTNKTISGTNNTITNIGNASLTNSAITFGATSQALGSTVSALNAVSIGQTTRAAGSFTTLDANGNVILGDATADTISANGRFNTNLVPSTDNARDLGTSALKWKQVFATTFTENGFPIVTQTDIGTAPNEIPLNQYLGNLAFMNSNQLVINPTATAVPSGIGDMVFELASDTSLVVKVRGSDGTVRSVALTLA